MYSEGSSDEDDDEDRVQERKMRTYEEYTAPAPQQPTILSWLKNSACNGTSAVVQSQTKVDFSPKPPQVRKLGQFMPNDMEWQLEELHSGSQQSPNEKGTKPSNVVIHSPMLTLPAASQSAVPNGQVRDDQRMPVCPYPRKAPVLSGKPACYGIESSPFSGRHIVPQKRNRHCGKVPTSENSRRPPHVKVQPTAKNIPSKPRDRKNTTSMNARENTQRDREEYLTRTANTEEKVVYSNDRVRSTFINRQRRSGAMKHLSLNDYFGTTAGMGSVACSYTLLNLVDISRDLVIYSSGYYDTVYYGKVVQEIGVVDLPRNYMVHRYMNEHELIANMGLDPPIQIAITEELSYIISSLENETRIALDVIGQKKHYHYVTDRRIKANGFEIRWIGKQHRIIEILSVCELNDHTPPGATEFLELLNLIGRQRRLSNQTRLGLACLRPRRMIRYLHQIANDALPHRATDAEAVELAILCEPAMETKIVRKLYPVRAIQ
ncbi:hypothetical protein BX666DRAFT_1171243 [Dichotomocladium elegans]|nr:hypothetical protein BX666DRAFT_1171243 [Dichotomocladium elegans]